MRSFPANPHTVTSLPAKFSTGTSAAIQAIAQVAPQSLQQEVDQDVLQGVGRGVTHGAGQNTQQDVVQGVSQGSRQGMSRGIQPSYFSGTGLPFDQLSLPRHSATALPHNPTQPYEPQINGPPGHRSNASVSLVPWAAQHNTKVQTMQDQQVLCCWCEEHNTWEPWYKFRIHPADG